MLMTKRLAQGTHGQQQGVSAQASWSQEAVGAGPDCGRGSAGVVIG